MTEQSVATMTRARCADCRRTYRVPDPGHAYTCKACGGEVLAPPRGSPADHQPSAEEVAARRNASSELKGGYRWMTAITWMYRFAALAYGGVTLAAIVALTSPEVPLRPGLLVVGLCTVLTVTMLMGAIQLLFEPFLWTLVIAILATMVAAVHWGGPNPLGLAFYFSAGWAALFWLSVVPTWRFRKLIAEHTDLYVTHHASRDTRRSLVGRSRRERHERLVRAMRRAFRRAIRISAVAGLVILLVSLGGSWLAVNRVRPHEVKETVAAFEQAWSSGAADQIGDLFLPQLSEARAAWLQGMSEAHGWSEGWPQLKPRREWTDADRVRWLEYNLEGGLIMTATFAPHRRRWVVGSIELPDPPLEPFVDRLVAAWESSDVRQLVALFPQKHAERMLPSIENSLQLRGWTQFPSIRETRIGDPTSGGADVVLKVRGGDLIARCLLDARGHWTLNALRFPEL